MPYNNTPIEPTSEITGTCSLPLARIKKIIRADPDTGDCSNNAAFAISVATESFIQYLVEQTHTVMKSERKPRRNVQYKDVAGAVSKYDNLEFLSDIVPHTVTFREYQKTKRAKEGKAPEEEATTNGQQTIAFAQKPSAAEDEEMAEAETSLPAVANGNAAAQSGSGSVARHNYDAVRNSFGSPPERVLPMEEG